MRKEWTFNYSAHSVHDAASKKRDHHVDRLGWWKDQQDKVMAKIRAEGLEIDESLAEAISNSYGRGPTINIRVDLHRDLQECVTKIREHRGKAEEYDGWVMILASQGAASLALDHQDWLFFFGDPSKIE